MRTFDAVGVVGSGTMGAGIAQMLALAGRKTVLYDVNQEVLQYAMGRLEASVEKGVQRGKFPENALYLMEEHLLTTTNIYELGENLDLIIEAIPEDLGLKAQIFHKLEEVCPDTTCFASNTSSLSITALAGATKRPRRFAGMHFFNPVPQMKLVEVIRGKDTDPAYVEELCVLAEAIGKTPVRVKDSPGFVVNRVARAFYGEAFRLLSENVAEVPVIDTIMREEGGFPMGPFELMDLIGIDVNYAVTQSVYHAYFEEPRFKPHPLQRQMVEAGHLGRKTGQGFYRYGD